MRPFTACYGLMTLSLGCVLFHGIASDAAFRGPFAEPAVFARQTDQQVNPIVIHAPGAKPSPAQSLSNRETKAADEKGRAVPGKAEGSTATPARTVSAGMTIHDVREALGEPDSISDDGSRWTYGSRVLIFNGESLAGQVRYDPIQAAMNKYNHMLASISDQTETPGASGSTSKVLRTKSAAAKSSTRYQYRPIPAGSARNAYRYNQRSEEYSYYMNRYGPMDRIFLRKPSMPRGMSSQYDRNMSRSYLRFGNSTRYGMNPNTAYRR